ncbi:TonB-dependent receptor plug domain-containing protein [Corallococcus sp. BB11-1]|uniref:TonB-dependent receptor plug domain-containing protein n=1 Tax=Corallococcus sp. BB11-1 TaxID=2996783 RepID=UPI00226EB7CA|nr:TonB-dependent receptor plug domain-containing protein [Corallococcus sp. BB11-1]MCY1036022.1 TonB-dependent receptor plug domain-containing protein [Corallococcus sp. BB11-1]
MGFTRRCGSGRRVGVLLALLGAGTGSAQTETGPRIDPGPPETPSQEARLEALEDEPEVHSQVASFAITKLHDSPAVVTSVTAEEIRASGARDLMDVLLLVPGFFFGVDVSGVVGPGFRGLWGQEGKVLLIIDGKEINEQLYSTMQLGHEFPVELIERIEVVRGPGSVIYGGNAELAVINVITRGIQGSTDVMAVGTYGQLSHGNGRRSLTLSGRKVFEGVPGLSAFASASLGQGQRSDVIFDDFYGGSASMNGASRLDPTVVQAGVGYRDLQLSLLYQRQDTTTVVSVDEVLPEPVNTDFESFHAELSDRYRPTDRIEIIPRLNLTLGESYRDSDEASDFFYDKRYRRLRGRALARWAALDVLQLTGGLDLAFDQGKLLGPAGLGQQEPFNGDQDVVSYRNFAGFVEAYSDNPIATVVAGARFEDHSFFGSSFVPRLVLLKSFGPVSGKALYSRAFRAPGIENISLGDDVRPERTTVYELEATVRLGEGQTVSANAFDVGVTDPIIYSYDTDTDSEAYRNLGRLGSRGVELDYRVRGAWGRAQVGYSFYRPGGRNDVEDYLVPGQPHAFTGLPTHKATLTGTARVLPWLSLSPTAVLVGQRFAVGAPDEEGVSEVQKLSPRLLLNLFVRAENVGTKGLEIGAGVYNLLGSDFRVAQPYNGGHAPLPVFTREFMVRLTYLFEPAYDDE